MGSDLGALKAEAIVLTTLRETAGPYLGFVEDGIGNRLPEGGTGMVIGRYRRSDWSVWWFRG